MVHLHKKGTKESKKNKISFDPQENQGYIPYLPDFYRAQPQMPYYYPFTPPVSSLPMQGYYPQIYGYPPEITQSKKVKGSKKNKKPE